MKKFYSPFVLLPLLLTDCAQVSAPTGGPKDVSPPKITRSVPENFSTGFSGKKIILEFNEFVQVKDIQKEIIISPPLNAFPEFTVKGKKLIIDLRDTLREAATYTLFLGKAVCDITEGNALDSNLFIFSTGSFLDSLSLNGNVVTAFDLKPFENALVMLYSDTADSVVCKRLPDYFAKTTKSGTFRINHIKTGKYKAFALEDKNNNFLFDPPEEQVSFIDTLVNPSVPTSVTLNLFRHENKKQYVAKSSAEKIGGGVKISVTLALPSHSPFLRLLNFSPDENQPLFTETSKNGDSLFFYAGFQLDTFIVEVNAGDSHLDTLSLTPSSKALSRKAVKMVIRFNTFGNTFDYFREMAGEFSFPVITHDLSKVIFLEQDDTLSFNGVFSDPANRFLKVKYHWKPLTKYKILLPPGIFHDIFGFTNDSMQVVFTTTAPESYGNLKAEVTTGTSQETIIVQLLNEKEQVMREDLIENRAALLYKQVIPGKYRLKAIIDSNRNKKWDTGDYFRKKQPEKVIFYAKSITIRANWEHEEVWEVGAPLIPPQGGK